MTTKTTHQPSHRAYIVDGDGENARWTEIGVAFAHKDRKGFNLQLVPGLAITGRIVLRPAKGKADAADNRGQQ